jgi:hypothetical protein
MPEKEQLPIGRGRPFPKGSSGRKAGSRNRATAIAAALAEGDTEALVGKALELALNGDSAMLKFFLGRILLRERLLKIDLPPTVYGDASAGESIARVVQTVAEGQISPSEGAALASLIECQRRALEVPELVARMNQLEAAINGLTNGR